MGDYVLALGDNDPYGFSAPDDRAAMIHAADYVESHGSAPVGAMPVVLSGPDGILTAPNDRAGMLRTVVSRWHAAESTDDIRPADPTPPDCNTG